MYGSFNHPLPLTKISKRQENYLENLLFMHSIVEFCFPLNLVLRTVFGQNFLNITITLRKKLIRDFNSLSVKTDARALLLDNSNFDNAYSRNLFHLIVARGAVFRKRGIWAHLRSI